MSLESARPVRLTRNTVATEFARYFGSEDKLENWQRLCRDVGIEDVPQSLKKCKQVRDEFCVCEIEFSDKGV